MYPWLDPEDDVTEPKVPCPGRRILTRSRQFVLFDHIGARFCKAASTFAVQALLKLRASFAQAFLEPCSGKKRWQVKASPTRMARGRCD
jgi:hypothetical protein